MEIVFQLCVFPTVFSEFLQKNDEPLEALEAQGSELRSRIKVPEPVW